MIKFKNVPVGFPKPASTLDAPAPTPVSAISADCEPEFKIKDFPQNYLTYHIHKHGTRTQAARPHDVVHASDLDPPRGWCPREPALLTLHGKKRPSSFVSTAQRMTWGMGYKGAELLTEMIPPEKVWGNWKCNSCKQVTSLSYTPKECPYCGAHRHGLRYQEVLLRDPVTGLIGSVDLFVDILGSGVKVPIEIKTEGNEGFKARTKPTFEHEWRTMLYLFLISKTPEVLDKGASCKEGRVVYFTKEGWADEPKIKEWKIGDWAKSSIKEYWVARNDDMIAGQYEAAASYRKWRLLFDSGVSADLPERVSTCASVACTRAKNCAVRKECWSGEPE